MEFNWKKIILIIIIIVLVAAVILYIVQSKTKDKVYEEYEPEEEISEEQENLNKKIPFKAKYENN